MLPSLREERAQTYSPFPPHRSKHRCRSSGAGHCARCQSRHHHLRKYRDRRARDHAGHRRPLQAAMEAGLGDALDRVRRRLRNGRQGSDRFGQAVRGNLPRARRLAAGRIQLRALSRRERPENLEIEGQRPHHRGMAALRQPGEPVAVHVSRAEGGEAAVFRRHPASRRRVPAIARRLSAARPEGAAVKSGLAHSRRRAAAGRQSGELRHAHLAGHRVERGKRRDAVGLHRPLPARRDAARRIRILRRWSTTPSITSATSCCRRKNSASRTRPNAPH